MTTNTFIAGNRFLYHMDPRAKLLAMVLFCIWFFLPVSLAGIYLVVLAVVLMGVVNTGLRHVVSTFRSILPMLIFMVLFMPLNVRGGEPLLCIGSWVLVTREGSLQVALLGGRFVGITYVCTLLFATTRMTDVMLALRWYRFPYKASLVVTLAFSYIPFIAETFVQISESHKLRETSDPEAKRGLFSRIGDLVPTLTSALVMALRSIPNLAAGLEQRGFGRKERRSSFHSLSGYRHTFTDFLLSCILVVILWGVFAV